MPPKRKLSSTASSEDAVETDSGATVARLLQSGAKERRGIMCGADPSECDILFRFFASHEKRLGVASEMLMGQQMAAMMHVLNPGAPDKSALLPDFCPPYCSLRLAPSSAAQASYSACADQTYVRLGCLFITIIGASGSSKTQVVRH